MSQLHLTLFSRMFWNVSSHYERIGMMHMLQTGSYWERFLFRLDGKRTESSFHVHYKPMGQRESGLYVLHSSI